ncbi:cohesin domain-containing protein [Dehalococcoidia bacterium]|nr:cohesin domain-containing protein [Dehalococcoidia bacterium]
MSKKVNGWRGGWTVVLILGLLLTLAGGSAVPTIVAGSEGEASVFLEPPSQTAAVGERVTVDIKINNVTGLYGAEVHLDFDPALLKVVDADAVMDGVQIAPSNALFRFDPAYYFVCPETGRRFYYREGEYFIPLADADNDAGTISYAFTLLHPASPVSIGPEGAVLATITFERLADGEARIDFVTVKLADAHGDAIPIPAENIRGAVVLVPAVVPPVNISIQPPTRSVVVGETFILDIQVDAGDQPVHGVSAFLDFDPTYLEVVSITPGDTLDVVLLNTYDNDAGTIDYSAGTLTEPFPSGTFVVATVEFKAIEETAATAIDFSTSEPRKTMAVYEGQDVTGAITGGTVKIRHDAPIFLQPPAITVCVGQTFELEIKTNVDDPQPVSGVAAFINFDAAKLEVVSVTPGPYLPLCF